MKRLLMALLAILIISHAWAAESSMRLELESSVRTLRLGQSTKLKLKLIGSGVYEITEQTEGINADNMKAGSFVYEFEFNPQRKGGFTFGPYSLTVNGQKLMSNQIEINVLPQWDGTYGTFFRIDKGSIVLGEDIELVVETWAKEYDRKSIFLDRKESFSSTTGGSSRYSSRSGKDGEVTYIKRSWFISPKKTGEFEISKELFREFPDDIELPEFTIQVKEPAQQETERDSQ